MNLKNYITDNYPIAGAFEGTCAAESRLLKHGYLVVFDDDKFVGILSPCDIVKRPHKILIDCLAEKESVSFNDPVFTVLDKFYTSQCLALPVFNENNFLGIIEKKQIVSDLEFKMDELYKKSLLSKKAKEYFLSNLSHQIRTPLNSILGFIDIISYLNTDDLNIQDEKISDVIRSSSRHFLLIINDLIELSLIHAGDEISIEKEDINIKSLFQELKGYFSEQTSSQNKKIAIIYSNPDDSQYIFSDEQKLKQILYHLIDNAIKFSADNRVIYGYELSPDKKNIEFFVINKSLNVLDKNSSKIFDIFEKQTNIGQDLNSGLGIGLSLAKGLTEMLEGNIRLESTGKEIKFLVNLPLR